MERSADELSVAKTNKQILLDGAAAFNTKPKVGLQFLEKHGVIYSDSSMPREESLARFFKTTPRLDKKLLGDFISRPDQLEVLRAFMRLMQFDGVRFPLLLIILHPNWRIERRQKIICDAMRELLEAFRLPGESQQIARITETFAEVYFATNPRTLSENLTDQRCWRSSIFCAADIKSQDATYVLSYSVIMLNTDLHNPQVRVSQASDSALTLRL
jgi:brefeldin A-resistance guanine nucleotide exchange factor 1